MPWNQQGGGGGGPWGSGPGPWGGRPGGGGQQPPDLEELLRRSQERVRNLFPGGGGGGIGPAGGRKGFHAEQSFGGVEVPVFEDEAHGGRIGERSETRKDETVSRLAKRTRL